MYLIRPKQTGITNDIIIIFRAVLIVKRNLNYLVSFISMLEIVLNNICYSFSKQIDKEGYRPINKRPARVV